MLGKRILMLWNKVKEYGFVIEWNWMVKIN